MRRVLLGLVSFAVGLPLHAQNLRFASTVAVGDNEVVVGEAGNSYRPGTVYVYSREGTAWRETAKLTAPDGRPRDGFGAAVAVAGNMLFVSTTNGGPVHLFQKSGAAWRHSGTIAAPAEGARERFGSVLAASGDWLLVGAPARTVSAAGGRGGGGGGGRAGGAQTELPSGAVYAFRREGTAWTQATRLAASDAAAGDAFGSAIAIENDQAVIGAPGRASNAGGAYVFRLDASAGTWQESGRMALRTAQPDQQLGASVGISGDRVVLGSPRDGGGYGASHVFARTEQGAWQERIRFARPGAATDALGTAIDVAGSETWVGVPGAGDSGGVTIFSTSTDGNVSVSTLAAPRDAGENDRFGATIDVRGSIAAIGAPGAVNGRGRVSIYEKDRTGKWLERTSIVAAVDALPAVTGAEVKCGDDGKARVFDCRNAELVSFLPVHMLTVNGEPTRLSGNWGWTHAATGREFALVGRQNGTAFVEVTDPANPKFLGELPLTPGARPSSWREIKTYRDHAYIVSDGSGAHGLQVFDLTQLLTVRGAPQVFKPTTLYTKINSAHNIVINEETGFAYSTGGSAGGDTCGGGLHMMSLKDPKNPEFVGCFAHAGTGRRGTGYTHDGQCVTYRGPDQQYAGREICLGSNETALSIADVTDKANPKAISQVAYPNVAYAHQGWLTADHRFFYSNDELDETGGLVQNTRTLVWDLQDLDDPKLVREFMGTTQASDHNLYVLGNTMYQSNYVAGLRIIDITDRANPREIGYFDTAPFGENTPGFSGTWSNYPFFKSGAILVTSGSEGMFLVKKRATPIM